MRQNSKRRSAKTVGKRVGLAAHVFRGILLESLGAAVLIFLFLTTRLTPEQLGQLSLDRQSPSYDAADSHKAQSPADAVSPLIPNRPPDASNSPQQPRQGPAADAALQTALQPVYAGHDGHSNSTRRRFHISHPPVDMAYPGNAAVAEPALGPLQRLWRFWHPSSHNRTH